MSAPEYSSRGRKLMTVMLAMTAVVVGAVAVQNALHVAGSDDQNHECDRGEAHTRCLRENGTKLPAVPPSEEAFFKGGQKDFTPKTETTLSIDQREWYAAAKHSNKKGCENGRGIMVNDFMTCELDDSFDRKCDELPLGRIVEFSERAGTMHTDAINGVRYTGWQGCLIISSRNSTTVIDARTRDLGKERTKNRRLVPAYWPMRNQIIVHSSTVSATDIMFGVTNTHSPAIRPGTGTSFDYVTQKRGYTEVRAAAMDHATNSWGGFDLRHIMKYDATQTSVRLQVGTAASRQVAKLFWERVPGTTYHGTVTGSHNIVKCMPNFHSVYVANTEQAEICLEIGQQNAATGGCYAASAEYGHYINACTNPTTNALVDIQGGLQQWTVEIGEISRNINFGDFTAKETVMGEIILQLS